MWVMKILLALPVNFWSRNMLTYYTEQFQKLMDDQNTHTHVLDFRNDCNKITFNMT